ncbi:MAG TPA: peptide ABC transporter substrate-binding protein [Gemmatimonadales bacterium]|nr:peptide ABC transporter substrate-binding protein [Gemmatimonadales bacterium]
MPHGWREMVAICMAAGAAVAASGCRERADGADRGRAAVVVAATGEPVTILPPLADETVARDIGDMVYERLADLEPGRPTIDSTAYRPRLAEGWERVDARTWRFHLSPTARWADGAPITAQDVRFSFDAYADSVLDSPARPNIAGRMTVTAEDSATVRIAFTEAYPEQLYDATYHVRIMPAHIWAEIPRKEWAADTALAHLVGSGPYRVTEWKRGQYLKLGARDEARTNIRELVWRFAPDPEATLNLILSHAADLMELAATPTGVARVERDTAFRVVSYPSAAYGFLGFNLAAPGAGGRTRLALTDRATRRALAMAIDRASLAHAVLGPRAVAPPGPMSRLLWIWSDSIRTIPYDTAAARRALDAAGWRLRSDGVRHRGGAALAFDVLVPATSTSRRQLAIALQEAWRAVGARLTVTAVDFPVFQERLGQGKFDSYIGAWLDEPSPRGLADQWTRVGWGALNYGHYANPRFDSIFTRATREGAPEAAARLYREAMDTLNADAPAIFLYSPDNSAAVSRRLGDVAIDPYSWLSALPRWTVH